MVDRTAGRMADRTVDQTGYKWAVRLVWLLVVYWAWKRAGQMVCRTVDQMAPQTAYRWVKKLADQSVHCLAVSLA